MAESPGFRLHMNVFFNCARESRLFAFSRSRFQLKIHPLIAIFKRKLGKPSIVKGKSVLVLYLLLLLSSLSYARFSQTGLKASSSLPVHNLSTGFSYTTIQEAIDANETLNGQTIKADSGTYYENVNIYKSVALVGEGRDSTIVDAKGMGSVIQIGTSNVSILNFTVRNAGKIWYGKGYPDSCIQGNCITHVNVENSTLTDAAVCVWFYSSSFIDVSNNIVSNATVMGVIGYASSSIVMNQNIVESCGGVGLHLDGNSVNCDIVNNMIMNCLEGIELEKSAGNSVEGNQLLGNNVSILLNQCIGSNVLRENNMTSDSYNLIVWGWNDEAFVQDIDTSNIVEGKTICYFVNSDNLTVNPVECPNMGFLAIVNCTSTAISDIDLSLNKDGLLIAESTSCCLTNITLSGNLGPLLYGGMTFFESNNNSVVDSRISNNSVGVCLYNSAGNIFYHNLLVNNSRQVVSNFYDPFSPPSGSYSINSWDSGFEGNYWSDYNGTDLYCVPYQNQTGSDGIGDTPHTIDANNTDYFPLMGMFQSYNVTYFTLPMVGHFCEVTVISNSTISGFVAPIWLEHPEIITLTFNVTGTNGSTDFCRVSFPTAMMNGTYHVSVNGTEVPCILLPCSNANVSYLYFTYKHSTEQVIIIPELPSILILPLFMMATLLAIVFHKRRSYLES